MITIMCFPANCTAILQPMDQNVINITKLIYKRSLLAHIIGSEGSDIEQKIKTFNLRNAVCLLANAWDKLPANVIKKCWNVLMSPQNPWTDEEMLPLSIIRAEILSEQAMITAVSDYLHEITPDITNEEINAWIFGENNSNYAAEDEDVESEEEIEITSIVQDLPKIKSKDAINSLNICIQWAEENKIGLKEVLLLQDLRETAVQKHISSTKKQSKISDFF